MLLPITLLIALPAQLDAPAAAEAPPPEVARAPAFPASDCAALFGAAIDVDDRRAAREARLADISRSEQLLDVVHSDAGWRAPRPTRLPGLDVVGAEPGPEGASTARVRLGEAWSETCPAGEYLVSVDDGLGSEGVVLAVLDEGVLAEHKGELIFVPRAGAGMPTFRMIWRSAFALNVTPGSNSSLGGGTSGASPRRNSRATGARDSSPTQRARANAKAAAEQRRNLSTRPARPRG